MEGDRDPILLQTRARLREERRNRHALAFDLLHHRLPGRGELPVPRAPSLGDVGTLSVSRGRSAGGSAKSDGAFSLRADIGRARPGDVRPVREEAAAARAPRSFISETGRSRRGFAGRASGTGRASRRGLPARDGRRAPRRRSRERSGRAATSTTSARKSSRSLPRSTRRSIVSSTACRSPHSSASRKEATSSRPTRPSISRSASARDPSLAIARRLLEHHRRVAQAPVRLARQAGRGHRGAIGIPSFSAITARRAAIFSAGILRKSNAWQRETIVRGTLCGSVVAKMNTACGRRLLQGLEERVERLVRQHVHFVDDVHLGLAGRSERS